MAHGFKVYRTKTLYKKKLLQNFETPRKWFSLILKLNHMLYKHDIKVCSDTNCWKNWFCITYKTHSESNTRIYFIHER